MILLTVAVEGRQSENVRAGPGGKTKRKRSSWSAVVLAPLELDLELGPPVVLRSVDILLLPKSALASATEEVEPPTLPNEVAKQNRNKRGSLANVKSQT